MNSLFHYLPTILLAIATVLIGVYAYTTRKNITSEIPSRTENAKLRREVAELTGLLADLEDRFTRFQKREGMRAARSEKERAQSIRDEAADILAGSNKEPPGKIGLYRRLGG